MSFGLYPKQCVVFHVDYISVFKLMFPCTGRMSAEVDVHFQMNISIFSASNLTVLNFKRRKMCFKGECHIPLVQHKII